MTKNYFLTNRYLKRKKNVWKEFLFSKYSKLVLLDGKKDFLKLNHIQTFGTCELEKILNSNYISKKNKIQGT